MQGQGAVVGEVGSWFSARLSGSIQASERVSIGETGSLEGAISAPRLAMADGAQLQGRVDV